MEHGELLPEDGRKTTESGWRWRVGKLELANGRVLLHDPAWPQAQAIAPIQASVAGLDSAASAAPAKLALSLADAQGALIKIDGTLNAAARSAKLKAEVAGLKPAPWLGPWQALLPVRVLDGSLALQAQLEADPKSWALQEGALQLSGLQLEPSAGSAAKPSPADKKPGNKRGAATDLLNLPKLEASGVQVHAPSGEALKAQVAALRFEGLDLKLSRGEHGEIAWLPPTKPTAAGESKRLRNEKPGPEPQWQIGELQCSACAVALSDRSVQPAAALSLTRTDFTLRKLGSDAKQPANFELALQAGHGGSAKARGELRLQPLALQSHMELAGLDLSVLQPYLDPYLNLTLRSAKAHAAGDLRIDGGAQGGIDVARWRGRMALRELRAVDKINSAEFLRFKNLSLDGADLAWKPAGITADLGTISLDSFYGRVILNADARLNLRDVVKREGREPARSITTPTGPEAAASAAQPAAAAAPAPQAASTPAPEAASAPAPAASTASAPAAAGPPPQLRWKAIHLTAGQIDFTDNFVRPNYSAQLTDVAGEVSGVAWNDPQPANVKISGKVDGSAPLEISGTVHPLGARLQTDITANARGIDITRLSTYSARYAGYGIDKGTLSVRVHYKIDNGKLEAQNNLHLDQLTFGGKVDSPNALKLPVLLAVSLLKDRNGVIDVDLPVSGSLDDPQFSIGGVIARVIVNLIAKALTAPFSLLSHAFSHGSAEELGYIEFAPGTAELSEASIKRLDALTEALNDRPTLKLEVTGRTDPAVDTEGLRQVHVEHLMLAAKAKATGELRDSVTIAPAERERWLAAAYKDADIKGKPRNLIGLQKSLPAAEMQALLEQSANAGPTQLGRLADERGDRVKAYLTAKVAPERVLLTASKLGTDGISDQGKTSRVSFDLK
ncbi:MAG TPA: DUF748 domain-containing protein [Methylibium sp.]